MASTTPLESCGRKDLNSGSHRVAHDVAEGIRGQARSPSRRARQNAGAARRANDDAAPRAAVRRTYSKNAVNTSQNARSAIALRHAARARRSSCHAENRQLPSVLPSQTRMKTDCDESQDRPVGKRVCAHCPHAPVSPNVQLAKSLRLPPKPKMSRVIAFARSLFSSRSASAPDSFNMLKIVRSSRSIRSRLPASGRFLIDRRTTASRSCRELNDGRATGKSSRLRSPSPIATLVRLRPASPARSPPSTR